MYNIYIQNMFISRIYNLNTIICMIWDCILHFKHQSLI